MEKAFYFTSLVVWEVQVEASSGQGGVEASSEQGWRVDAWAREVD